MASGKGTPGAGLQIPLERDRSLLVGELHDDVDLPWPPTRGVKAAAAIVRLDAGAPVTGDAGVIALGISETPKNIDAAFWDPHRRGPVQFQFRTMRLRISARRLEEYAESATLHGMNQANSAKHNAAVRTRSPLIVSSPKRSDTRRLSGANALMGRWPSPPIQSERAVHRRGRN